MISSATVKLLDSDTIFPDHRPLRHLGLGELPPCFLGGSADIAAPTWPDDCDVSLWPLDHLTQFITPDRANQPAIRTPSSSATWPFDIAAGFDR